MTSERGLAHYRDSGVDYERLDATKRSALGAALSTSPFLAAMGGRALDASRGEPAFVFDVGGQTLALVMEGLGTKGVIARQYLEETGRSHFDAIAYDTVAAILNDLICVGALPLVVSAYFATGNASWYDDDRRLPALLEGWRQACEDARCTWGGGESPSLPGLVDERDIELAGCAVGALPDGVAPVLGDDLGPGDEIVLVESSGLHANGASLARAIAAREADGYLTDIGGGQDFGAALLAPSILYVELVRRVLAARIGVHYLSHITGHGFLKLMRPQRELTYRITDVPPVPPVLAYMVEAEGMGPKAAYSTFNMGAGFALYVAAGDGARVVEVARDAGLQAWVAGRVEEGPRRVIVEPAGIEFGGEDLELR